MLVFLSFNAKGYTIIPIKPSGYFMYHQLKHSQILVSSYELNAHFLYSITIHITL